MPDAVKDLIARAESRKSERSTLDSHLEEIRKIFLPFAVSFLATQTPGDKVHQDVLDSTPEQAVDILVAGLLARLTSPVERWFSLRAMDDRLNEMDEVQAWLEAVTDRCYAVFNSPTSFFGPQQQEKYHDLVTFGGGVMFIGDKPGLGVPVFQTRPMKECYLSEDSEGQIDTVDRWFKLTARQAVQEFGLSNVGRKIADAYHDPRKQESKFSFLHLVYPRQDYDPGRRDRRNLPIASCFINLDETAEVEVGGFEEFPYSTPRWSKRAGDVYGRGPGMKTLADGKMLQRMMRVTIRGAEKVIDPPLIVASDGVVGPIRSAAAGLTYVDDALMMGAGAPIRPLITGARPDIGEDLMNGVRKRLEGGFFTALLQFARDPKMTATQVLNIDEQTQLVLSPLLGRLQVEDLNPLVKRVYAIELRNNRLPPVPEILSGQGLKIEYVSPAVRLQKIARAKAMAQSVELLGPLIQQNPEILDNWDTDKIAREMPVLLGAPADWLRPVRVVQQMRRARAQVAQEQQQKADAAAMVESAGRAAPIVKALQGPAGAAANAA